MNPEDRKLHISLSLSTQAMQRLHELAKFSYRSPSNVVEWLICNMPAEGLRSPSPFPPTMETKDVS